jgi:uncharacterized protein (UPF0218 family)
MTIKYLLTPELRFKLKQPLGILIEGSFLETMKRLRALVEKEKPPSIVAVGDTVSRNLTENGFAPKLAIVDNKCMRRNIKPQKLMTDQTFYVKNPQGTITQEAQEAIASSLQGKQTVKIVIDGEEDLLTLPAIIQSADNSFVIYGQPYAGIVVVKATSEKKSEIQAILKSIEVCSKS